MVETVKNFGIFEKYHLMDNLMKIIEVQKEFHHSGDAVSSHMELCTP